jgi:hypothetical protein
MIHSGEEVFSEKGGPGLTQDGAGDHGDVLIVG